MYSKWEIAWSEEKLHTGFMALFDENLTRVDLGSGSMDVMQLPAST